MLRMCIAMSTLCSLGGFHDVLYFARPHPPIITYYRGGTIWINVIVFECIAVY